MWSVTVSDPMDKYSVIDTDRGINDALRGRWETSRRESNVPSLGTSSVPVHGSALRSAAGERKSESQTEHNLLTGGRNLAGTNIAASGCVPIVCITYKRVVISWIWVFNSTSCGDLCVIHRLQA